MTADHLGSARIITNENGAVTKRQDYGAFGDEIVTSQRTNRTDYTTGDELREGYTGYEKDDESGLDYAQARYYNSGHGRFTSVDPLTASATIRNPQSFNRYSYVLNSPYKFVDPLGLLSSSPGKSSWGMCGADYSSCSEEGLGGFGNPYFTEESSAGDYQSRQPESQTVSHTEAGESPENEKNLEYYLKELDKMIGVGAITLEGNKVIKPNLRLLNFLRSVITDIYNISKRYGELMIAIEKNYTHLSENNTTLAGNALYEEALRATYKALLEETINSFRGYSDTQITLTVNDIQGETYMFWGEDPSGSQRFMRWNSINVANTMKEFLEQVRRSAYGSEIPTTKQELEDFGEWLFQNK